jgi:Tol biopolymer transport system component/DNA-binding winged helix-turn-helix (wHTH) protein
LDLDTAELRRNGTKTSLQSQPFQILTALLENPGQLVTREELTKRLWPTGTFVDFDQSLNKAVGRLREALGDNAEKPLYIETLSRRGYRWKSPVRGEAQKTVPFPPTPLEGSLAEREHHLRYQSAVELRTDPEQLKQAPEPTLFLLPPSSSPRIATFAWASPRVFLYGLTLAVGLLGLGFAFHEYLTPRHAPMIERQLTRNTSERRGLSAAISPDGRYVASTTTAGLYVSSVSTAEVHEIPLPEELKTNLWFVSWFPDNEKLLFTVQKDTDHEIWSASILGGSLRKLREGCNQGAVSPDGGQIVASCEHFHEMWIIGATGENAKKLAGEEFESYGGFSWSPTGRRLAYVKTKLDGSSRVIETASVDGGPPTVVLSDPGLLDARQMVTNLAWLHDGRMLFVLEKNERDNLWEIRVDSQTGKPIASARQITNWDKWDALSLSITHDDQRLLVEKLHIRQDIYVGELKENGTRLDAPRRLTFSDSQNFVLGWSPDSKAIFFQSDRTGAFQSYQQKLDQEDSELLTPIGGAVSAVATPDGRSILYWSSQGNTYPLRLMRLPLPQGAPQQVLEFPAGEVADFDCPQRAPSDCVLYRSEKDQWIFYELNPLQGLGREIKRFKLSTPKERRLTTPKEFALSPDGMHFATLQGRRSGKVIVLDLNNGEERIITLPARWAVWGLSWTPDGKGMYLATQDKGYLMVRLSLDGKFRVLLDRGRDNWLGFPMTSRDSLHLAFSQQVFENNAWLLENF